MAINFRRGKKVGPFNFTVSKSGVSASIGKGPFRYTRNSNGGRTTTVRSPIKGLYYQQRSTPGQTQAKKARRKTRANSADNFRATVNKYKDTH